jgi:uncharacterized repeat protein (TIGR04052 family)
MNRSGMSWGAGVLALAVAVSGCGSGDEGERQQQQQQPQSLTLPFEARVGPETFSCERTFALGTPGTTYTPEDFRLYVSNVRLVSESGAEVPVQLSDDGAWQRDGAALLDFENRANACSNGTAETNTRLVGSVPAGRYHTLRFTVGLPPAQNHQDATAAPPPFNSSAMFWGWQAGYKFIKIDGSTPGLPAGHNFHLGSIGCTGSAPTRAPSACAAPNRVEVELTDFDPATSKVVMDLAALFAGSDLDQNAPQTAPGCMSGATDADCGPLFARLGLAFGDQPAGAQRFFRKE